MSRAVRDGAVSDNEIWFAQEQWSQPIQELAACFGNPDSQRIRMHSASVHR